MQHDPAGIQHDPAGEFECFLAHDEGGVSLILRGELDMATAPAFSAMVAEAMEKSRHLRLRMDDLLFLDSAGLRVMALAAVALQPDGSVTIYNAPRFVARLLEVTGLDNQLILETS